MATELKLVPAALKLRPKLTLESTLKIKSKLLHKKPPLANGAVFCLAQFCAL